jgi:hypothetical protein
LLTIADGCFRVVDTFLVVVGGVLSMRRRYAFVLVRLLRQGAVLGLAAGASTAFAADAGGFVEVGPVPARCPITVEPKPTFRVPSSWKLTPQQAVELAAKAGFSRCNDIFQQVLFTDAENYYIVKSVFGPMSKSSRAVVIDGVTGKVSVQNSDATAAQPGH